MAGILVMAAAAALGGCTSATLWVLSGRAMDPPLPDTLPATRDASTCPERTATAVGRSKDGRLREVSGLVASQRHAGLFYCHNDSGDSARVFLVDRDGSIRAEIALRGALAVDYEAISLAPGAAPGVYDVCVADIGDNQARRPQTVIYRFSEVELPPAAGSPGVMSAAAALTVEVVAYPIRYEDGPADAEAFCVHPRTGDGFISTKRTDGRSVVYLLAAPWKAGTLTVLPRLTVIALPPAVRLARVVTGADIRPDGRAVAVRGYVGGWEWHLPEGVGDADFRRIFDGVPCRLELAPERQGEALCYSADGSSILTISEGPSPALWEHVLQSETGNAGAARPAGRLR